MSLCVFCVAIRRHVVRLFDIFNNRNFQFLPKKLDFKDPLVLFWAGVRKSQNRRIIGSGYFRNLTESTVFIEKTCKERTRLERL